MVVLANSETDANRLGAAVVENAARNHGFPAGALRPRLEGPVARGQELRVTVHTEVDVVRLPFVGSLLPSLSVPVEATHLVKVDRYRSFAGGAE